MEGQTKTAKVWIIYNNELVCKNKKPSVKMHQYLEEIYKKIKEENQIRLKNKKKVVVR